LGQVNFDCWGFRYLTKCSLLFRHFQPPCAIAPCSMREIRNPWSFMIVGGKGHLSLRHPLPGSFGPLGHADVNLIGSLAGSLNAVGGVLHDATADVYRGSSGGTGLDLGAGL